MKSQTKTLTLYHNYESMLKQIAWSFIPGDIDIDDLIAEANLTFFKVIKSNKYNPKRGAFTTYLHRCVTQALRDLYRKEKKRKELELIHTQERKTTTKHSRIMELMDELNNDCKTIIQLILETPGDIKTLSKTGIRSHLLAQGWGRRKINKNMDSLSKTVTNEII